MKHSARWLGYCLAISGGVLWAVAGACGQALFRNNTVTAGWLVPIRLILAGLLFLLLARITPGPVLFAVWKDPRAMGRLLVCAVFGVAASQYTFYGAIELANVAFSTVMCYICPIFILLYTILRERRRPRLYEAAGVVLVVVGVFACATHFDLTRLSVSPVALVMGLLCALSAAMNTLMPLPLNEKYGIFPIMGWGMLLGGGVMVLMFRPWTIQPIVNAQLIGSMAVIIIGGTVLAFSFYMRGIQLVGPVAAVVLSAAEPLTAVVLSVLVLKDSFTPSDYLGFCLILLTIPVISIGQQKELKETVEAPSEKEDKIMIRLAGINDLDAIDAIYQDIHDGEEAGRTTIGWIRSIYPTRATAEASIRAGDMFVMEEDGTIVAAARINQEQVPEYADAAWADQAPPEQVMVLHTLVVSPRYAGKGYGTRFVAWYEDYARSHGCPFLRMDTNERNKAARALYARLGYREPDIVDCEFNGIPGVRLVCLEKNLGTTE